MGSSGEGQTRGRELAGSGREGHRGAMGGSRGAAAGNGSGAGYGTVKGRAASSHNKGGQRGRGRVQLSEVSMDRGRAEAGQTGGTQREQSRDRDGRGGLRSGSR